MAHKRNGTLPEGIYLHSEAARLEAWFKPGDPDECWPWQGTIDKKLGYGLMDTDDGERPYAHRYIYARFVGPIPEGMDIGHICHDADESCAPGVDCPHRRCVNYVNHLKPQTRSENLRASGRVIPPEGRPFQPGHVSLRWASRP